jgi:hypothetical protein
MKLSWTSLKISIAGAKLSHLVQKDKIWDHGSMAEQARIIFYLVQKALINGNIGVVKKYMTSPCFEKLQQDMMPPEGMNKVLGIEGSVIKELAVIEVCPAKNNKPDRFTAILKGDTKIKNEILGNDQVKQFSVQWSFIRQGDWWLLDRIRWPFSLLINQ